MPGLSASLPQPPTKPRDQTAEIAEHAEISKVYDQPLDWCAIDSARSINIDNIISRRSLRSPRFYMDYGEIFSRMRVTASSVLSLLPKALRRK